MSKSYNWSLPEAAAVLFHSFSPSVSSRKL